MIRDDIYETAIAEAVRQIRKLDIHIDAPEGHIDKLFDICDEAGRKMSEHAGEPFYDNGRSRAYSVLRGVIASTEERQK